MRRILALLLCLLFALGVSGAQQPGPPDGAKPALEPGPVKFVVVYRSPEQRDMFVALNRYCVVTGAGQLQCQVLFDNRAGQGIRSFGVSWELIDAEGHVFDKVGSLDDFDTPLSRRPGRVLGKAETFRLERGWSEPLKQPAEIHCHVRFVELADGSVEPPSAAFEEEYKTLLDLRKDYPDSAKAE